MNIEVKINQVQVYCLETVRTFLAENEQYGDDWSAEIEVLNSIIDNYYDECAALKDWEEVYLAEISD